MTLSSLMKAAQMECTTLAGSFIFESSAWLVMELRPQDKTSLVFGFCSANTEAVHVLCLSLNAPMCA